MSSDSAINWLLGIHKGPTIVHELRRREVMDKLMFVMHMTAFMGLFHWILPAETSWWIQVTAAISLRLLIAAAIHTYYLSVRRQHLPPRDRTHHRVSSCLFHKHAYYDSAIPSSQPMYYLMYQLDEGGKKSIKLCPLLKTESEVDSFQEYCKQHAPLTHSEWSQTLWSEGTKWSRSFYTAWKDSLTTTSSNLSSSSASSTTTMELRNRSI